MPNGTVKFFNVQKGFGFITPDDGTKDVFMPAASIVASGITDLKAGLRVAFETQPDTKGPKAVELTRIAAPPPPKADQQKQPVEKHANISRLTVYLDPASELASDAVAELRDAGFEPRLVDYIANPPAAAELKALSLLLREGDQSLVRRFDPLYSELRLDDRFISDGEYWTAVHEHPTLINGPVLATATKARVCRTERDVEAFVKATAGGTAAVSKPKPLPPSLLRLLAGDKAPPAAVDVEEPTGAKPIPTVAAEKRNLENTVSIDTKRAPKAKAAPAAKAAVAPKLESKAKAKPKAEMKTRKAAKQTQKKPVNKTRKK